MTDTTKPATDEWIIKEFDRLAGMCQKPAAVKTLRNEVMARIRADAEKPYRDELTAMLAWVRYGAEPEDVLKQFDQARSNNARFFEMPPGPMPERADAEKLAKAEAANAAYQDGIKKFEACESDDVDEIVKAFQRLHLLSYHASPGAALLSELVALRKVRDAAEVYRNSRSFKDGEALTAALAAARKEGTYAG